MPIRFKFIVAACTNATPQSCAIKDPYNISNILINGAKRLYRPIFASGRMKLFVSNAIFWQGTVAARVIS